MEKTYLKIQKYLLDLVFKNKKVLMQESKIREGYIEYFTGYSIYFIPKERAYLDVPKCNITTESLILDDNILLTNTLLYKNIDKKESIIFRNMMSEKDILLDRNLIKFYPSNKFNFYGTDEKSPVAIKNKNDEIESIVLPVLIREE